MAEPVVVTETELSLVKWLGGLAVTALAGLLGLIYTKHEKDFDKLELRVDKVEECKADKAETDKRLDRGADKFDELLELQRQGNAKLDAMHVTLAKELGDRPTRAEVQQMLQQSGRGL